MCILFNTWYGALDNAPSRRSEFSYLVLIAVAFLRGYDKVSRRLKQATTNLRELVPRCRLDTYGRRASFIAGLMVRKSLPDESDPKRGSDSFKQFLKTILFSFY